MSRSIETTSFSAGGAAHAGIVYLKYRGQSISEIIRLLLDLRGRRSADEMRGRVEYG